MKIFLEGNNGQHIVTNDTLSVEKLLKSKKFRVIDADSYASRIESARLVAEEERIKVIKKDETTRPNT